VRGRLLRAGRYERLETLTSSQWAQKPVPRLSFVRSAWSRFCVRLPLTTPLDGHADGRRN